MIKNFYIHCGLDKTGSTAIQGYLHENRFELLETHGIGIPPINLHPLIGSYFSEDPASYTHNFITLGSEMNIRHINERDSKAFDDFESWLDINSNIQTVILSHEGYPSMLGSNGINSMIKYLRNWANSVSAIAYYRPAISYAKSAISQSIVSGQAHDEDSLVDYLCEEYNYDKICSKFYHHFGKKNTIFKIFDTKMLFEGNVIVDFMHEICDGLHVINKNLNASQNQSITNDAALCGMVLRNKLIEDGISIQSSQFYRRYYKFLQSIDGEPIKLKPESIKRLKDLSGNAFKDSQNNVVVENKTHSLSGQNYSLTDARIEYLYNLAIQKVNNFWTDPIVVDTSGEIMCTEDNIYCTSDSSVSITVSIKNNSKYSWISSEFVIYISYHIKGIDSNLDIWEGKRTELNLGELASGESHEQLSWISAPSTPGKYLITWTLIQEDVVWFDLTEEFTPSTSILTVVANNPTLR